MPKPPLYSLETYGQLEPGLHEEWLLTNGTGAFSASTVVGCNTRRYHALLIAATLPPVGRITALNRVGEILHLDGDYNTLLELFINQFDNRYHPRGDQYLRSFHLGDTAKWIYDVNGVRITKEIQLLWQRNIVALRYTLEPPPSDRPRQMRLRLLPFTALRDFHSQRQAGPNLPVRQEANEIIVTSDQHELHLGVDQGRFEPKPAWWFGHTYAIETERGLPDHEDLFCPGEFIIDTDHKTTVTLWASIETIDTPNWDEELKRRPDPCIPAAAKANCKNPSLTVRRLLNAASDFVVARKAPDGSPGTTIIAGYPWFADWGRDTMISLPGLLLTTGRFDEACKVLSVFANYVSEGMIPNRFDDYTNEPHYNTVDASLWFIHAAHEYLKRTQDYHTFETTLLPACRAIIEGYRRGTRFNIAMDETDGLITQGDPHTQLTWMDAKCGDVAFTPRQGKPVEINALWYHALVLMQQKELAAKVRESFAKSFWISPFRGLADVITDGRQDKSIRPNQIFAVSLSNSPLDADKQAAVVEVVRRELLTPVGLRSLAKSDPRYHGRYRGPQEVRDEAYHNGTVWAWLIGPFLEAYLRTNNRSPESIEQAKRWLQPLIQNMEQASIGQISEIFEADEPHRPVGCFAQAWSVAEALRLAVDLGM